MVTSENYVPAPTAMGSSLRKIRCAASLPTPTACLAFFFALAHTLLMETAEAVERITVEDYLSGELRSEVRHEFIGGSVYAMAGASEEHNTLAGNMFAALHTCIGDGPCRVFMVDMKVRLEVARDEVFYY